MTLTKIKNVGQSLVLLKIENQLVASVNRNSPSAGTKAFDDKQEQLLRLVQKR